MAHFAKLNEDNIVVDVNVVGNEDVQHLEFPESEAAGIQFLNNWAGAEYKWKQTSYNANFRKNYAGIGYTYDAERDAFIPPQPFPSWVLDENSCLWSAPVPYPDDGNLYQWNEESLLWTSNDPV